MSVGSVLCCATEPSSPSNTAQMLLLLVRSDSRKTRFVHGGVCYQCRSEKRRSLTRSFSPRDCAGYSLCGPTAREDCE